MYNVIIEDKKEFHIKARVSRVDWQLFNEVIWPLVQDLKDGESLVINQDTVAE